MADSVWNQIISKVGKPSISKNAAGGSGDPGFTIKTGNPDAGSGNLKTMGPSKTAAAKQDPGFTINPRTIKTRSDPSNSYNYEPGPGMPGSGKDISDQE